MTIDVLKQFYGNKYESAIECLLSQLPEKWYFLKTHKIIKNYREDQGREDKHLLVYD